MRHPRGKSAVTTGRCIAGPDERQVWVEHLPVSTTHVLSSDMAGTMAANGSGAQLSTVRSLALTWVLTLPCAIALSACLIFVFRHPF